MKLTAIVRLFCTALVLACTAAGAQAAQRVWDFRVFLDDSPIGYHRFTLRDDGAERDLKVEARFDVKILFFNAYKYTHDAMEHWRGNCLQSLNARTDDNGKRLAVDSTREGDRLAVVTARARELLEGCVMSFAYWNPEILRQPRLLNPQTGEYEAVNVAALGEESIVVRGAAVPARHYRITGPKHPIDLWYSAAQEWLALDSEVDGGRKLRYRIER